MRSIARSLGLGGALFCIAGCLGDGLPWGELNASVTASFAPSPGRLDAQGRLKTASNYVVALEDVAVGFDALSVVLPRAAGLTPPIRLRAIHYAINGHCLTAARSSTTKTSSRWRVVQAVRCRRPGYPAADLIRSSEPGRWTTVSPACARYWRAAGIDNISQPPARNRL